MLGFVGWTGVDLFFVLSGFLITGILWEAKESPHYFKNFYARRTLRLFPLYYATLAIIFIGFPLMLPSLMSGSDALVAMSPAFILAKEASVHWLWFITYSVDFLVGWKGYLFASHFWSLAVEEHFYLVWPFLILTLSRRSIIRVTFAIIFGSLALRLCVSDLINPVTLYVLTPLRMDAIAMGSAVALIMRGENGLQLLRRIARVWFPILAVFWGLLMLYLNGWPQYGDIPQTVGYTLTASVYACLLILTLTENFWKRLFSIKFLRFLGKYSYGLYVIHAIVFECLGNMFALGNPSHYTVLKDIFPGVPALFYSLPHLVLVIDGAIFAVLALGLTLLAALASWRYIESPFLGLKKFFPYGRESEPARLPVGGRLEGEI